MNRWLFPLLLVILAGASSAPACMNDYHPNVAAIQRSDSVLEQLRMHTLKEPWDVRRDRLRKELAAGGDYQVKNDLATSLAHTGQAGEAVTLLEQIEAEKPGLYVTAANLGTAYELAGNNEKALEWIRQGIARNPRAHEGTEWLHVRILQAKLALKDDPQWLGSNSILGARTSSDPADIAAVGNRGEKLSREQIKAALIYQLHERLQFVPPPDTIVGSLLLDLGELLSTEPTGIGGAKSVFQLAANYLHGLPGAESLQQNADFRLMRSTDGQQLPGAPIDYLPAVFMGLVGLLLGAVVIGIKRKLEAF